MAQDNLDLIIFDFDRTLVDFGSGYRAAASEVFTRAQQFVGPLPVERLVDIMTSIDAENWAGFVAGDYSVEVMWRHRWERPLARLGHSLSDEQLAVLSELYESRLVEGTYLFPDAIPCLETLTASGCLRLALLTNGPTRTAGVRLRRVGLEGYFTFLGISEEIGYWKPDPRAFETVLRGAGSTAERALMVGDNLVDDIGGAANLGIRTVWLNRSGAGVPGAAAPGNGEPEVRPDYVVPDLASLTDLIVGQSRPQPPLEESPGSA